MAFFENLSHLIIAYLCILCAYHILVAIACWICFLLSFQKESLKRGELSGLSALTLLAVAVLFPMGFDSEWLSSKSPPTVLFPIPCLMVIILTHLFYILPRDLV